MASDNSAKPILVAGGIAGVALLLFAWMFAASTSRQAEVDALARVSDNAPFSLADAEEAAAPETEQAAEADAEETPAVTETAEADTQPEAEAEVAEVKEPKAEDVAVEDAAAEEEPAAMETAEADAKPEEAEAVEAEAAPEEAPAPTEEAATDEEPAETEAAEVEAKPEEEAAPTEDAKAEEEPAATEAAEAETTTEETDAVEATPEEEPKPEEVEVAEAQPEAEPETAAAAAPAATVAAASITGDSAAGAKVYRKCKACHKIGEGAKNAVGPHLTDVVGRVMGSVEGFKYSDGFVTANEEGRVWTPEELSAYLTKPRDYMKGTRMAFPGLRKEKDRDDVIAYLASNGE